MTRAVVLLSGGLDSATCLAIAKDRGLECHALSFDYGQRHRVELDRARRQAEIQGVAAHHVEQLSRMGGSALTDRDVEVPRDSHVPGLIPVTYVPARNTIFLALALGLAERLDARFLYIGANSVDYSGYPDCRPEFLAAFEVLANLGTKAGVENPDHFRVVAPLIDLSKGDIVKWGLRLGVDYGATTSCYDPDPAGRPCRHCDSCHLRRRGFQDAGVADPAS